jgi:hypothetical protein
MKSWNARKAGETTEPGNKDTNSYGLKARKSYSWPAGASAARPPRTCLHQAHKPFSRLFNLLFVGRMEKNKTYFHPQPAQYEYFAVEGENPNKTKQNTMNFPQQYYTLQFIRDELQGKTNNDSYTVSEIQKIAIRASEVILEEMPQQHNEQIRVAREKTLALLKKAIAQAERYQEEILPLSNPVRRCHVSDARTPALDAVEMYTRIVFAG